MIELTLPEFKEWAFNPCTEIFVDRLKKIRSESLEHLGSNFHKTPEAIQRTIGTCQSLQATIDSIESYKIVQEVKEEEAKDATI